MSSLVLVERVANNQAVMRLNNAPVNMMTLELLEAMTYELRTLEDESPIRGVVLTSTSPSVFSAGLSLDEMVGSRVSEWWSALQTMWLTLYSSRLAIVAAVNGHAPAGGCLVSMGCDYRVMRDDGVATIGLNETRIGIVPPFWFVDAMVNTVGYRRAESLCQLGTLCTPGEALRCGLVDEVVGDADALMSAAHAALDRMLEVSDEARARTKLIVRDATLRKFERARDQDLKETVAFIESEPIQTFVTAYLAKLKQRRQK
jgi:Delta3-Delta2-enoyl-CoA isomerase